jgi:molecular chaperone DnaK
MSYDLGVDLGTSFTAAAVAHEGRVSMVTLGEESIASPSVVFAHQDGTLLTGEAAEWRAVGDPMRIARGFKRWLGDPTPLIIGGAPYAPAALLAALLRDTVARVTQAEGEPPSRVVLSCPAVWGPYRLERFGEVPRLAGLTDPSVTLVTEPEAVAAHYASERRLGAGELIAVYDLGGGTFDATVLRARPGGMEILGTPEGIERLGGIDFDEALLAHANQLVDGAVGHLDPADPAAGAALTLLRRDCVAAKERLSTEQQATFMVRLPDGNREVTVTRAEFEDMIRPSVQLTVDALRRTLASAEIEPQDLAAVLLAGGSSRIPLVGEMVSEEFGRPVRVSLHPKFTVALGAAASATDREPASEPVVVTPSASAPGEAIEVYSPPESDSSRPRLPVLLRDRRVLVVAAVVVMALAVAGIIGLRSGGGDTAGPPPTGSDPSNGSTHTPCRDLPVGTPSGTVYLMIGNQPCDNYTIGVDSSGHQLDWLTRDSDAIKVSYPSGQSWGTAFLTLGSPAPAGSRPGQNISKCSTLQVDLRTATAGATLGIGIKDKYQLDTGAETKIRVTPTESWQTKSFPLASFTGTDLSAVYVMFEVVFESKDPPQTTYFRNVRLQCG